MKKFLSLLLTLALISSLISFASAVSSSTDIYNHVAEAVYFVMFLLLKGLTREELFDFPMGRRLYLVARKMRVMK